MRADRRETACQRQPEGRSEAEATENVYRPSTATGVIDRSRGEGDTGVIDRSRGEGDK